MGKIVISAELINNNVEDQKRQKSPDEYASMLVFTSKEITDYISTVYELDDLFIQENNLQENNLQYSLFKWEMSANINIGKENAIILQKLRDALYLHQNKDNLCFKIIFVNKKDSSIMYAIDFKGYMLYGNLEYIQSDVFQLQLTFALTEMSVEKPELYEHKFTKEKEKPKRKGRVLFKIN